jgi:F-type H+-transporting ATPase subunit c
MFLAEVDQVAVATASAAGTIAIAKGLGAAFAALAVGFIGTKAAEGVSRNPAAATKILVQSILGMALAEGLGLLSILMIK